MLHPNKTTFLIIWPKCFTTFLGVIEFIAFVMFILTELCSVAANFWVTNVFAGGWCGIIVLIHAIFLFIAGLCSPGPSSAFRAALLTILMFIACGALISFDIAFIVQPSTCILTSSCSNNAYSSSVFSYSFRSSFFSVFNSWDPFKTYTQDQVKLLCQAIQLGLAALCVIIGIVYLVIYFECLRRLKKHQQLGDSSSPNAQNYNSISGNSVSPLPNGPRSALTPPPVTPGQIFPTSIQQPVYMLPPPPQQVYVTPTSAHPPPPIYYQPPPPVAQPIYYAPPPPPPAAFPIAPQPQMYRAPAPFSAQAQATVRPWYAHKNY